MLLYLFRLQTSLCCCCTTGLQLHAGKFQREQKRTLTDPLGQSQDSVIGQRSLMGEHGVEIALE